MQRIITFLLLLLGPIASLADGIVFPPTAYPARVVIPDQRALICFTNGTERLVIETRFTGSGTNFAWVVPLPNPPFIEEASTGLFPTLQYLFRPRIIYDVDQNYPWFFALIWLGYVVLFVRPTGQIRRLDFVPSAFVLAGMNVAFWTGIHGHGPTGWALATLNALVFLDLTCVVLLVRFWGRFSDVTNLIIVFFVGIQIVLVGLASGTAGGKATASMVSPATPQGISILDRKLVGVFETTTITAQAPDALENWLRENGFAVSADARPVIVHYLKSGWVFVAAQVRRGQARRATSTPHPLSFTFKTERPVYPMRLTGVNNGPLSVELYVFGPARAGAAHFRVTRCTRPNYPKPPPNDFWSWHWSRTSSETPNIVHPLLRKWVKGLPVATKLTAVLPSSAMRQDVWIDWTPFSETKEHRFSKQGALTTALNWGVGLFAVALLVLCLVQFTSDTLKPKLPSLVGAAVIVSLALIGSIYWSLPKTEVRLTRIFPGTEHESLFLLYEFLLDTNPVTRAQIEAEARQLLADPAKDPVWARVAGPLKNLDNTLLGGRIREEDSPGNFTLRESGNQLEFITYDAEGAGHLAPHPWTLRAPP